MRNGFCTGAEEEGKVNERPNGRRDGRAPGRTGIDSLPQLRYKVGKDKRRGALRAPVGTALTPDLSTQESA